MKFWWIFVFMILVFDGPIKGYGDEADDGPNLTTSSPLSSPKEIVTQNLNAIIEVFGSSLFLNESVEKLVFESANIGNVIFAPGFKDDNDNETVKNFNASIENYFSTLNQSIKHTEDIIRNLAANSQTPNSDIMLTEVHIPFKFLQKSYEKMMKNLDSPKYVTFFKDACNTGSFYYDPFSILEHLISSVIISDLLFAEDYCERLIKHTSILCAACETALKGPLTVEAVSVLYQMVQHRIEYFEHIKQMLQPKIETTSLPLQ